MPDQTHLLNNLLHSLSTIDQRLSRIENALRIPPLNGAAAAATGPGAAAPHGQTAAFLANGVAPSLAVTAVTVAGHHGPTQVQQPRPIYPAVKPLEAPPEGFAVSCRASMQDELDGWTVPRGYSMRINGTRTHGARQKIRLVCFRGGRSRPRARSPVTEEAIAAARAAGRRKPTTDRASKKCDCPFKFELVELGPGMDRYTVHYTNKDNMLHNHAPADLTLDPRARKLPSQVTAEVDQWLRDNMSIAKIQEELRKRGYAHVLDFDLRNRKRSLQRKDGLLNGGGGRASGGAAGAVGGIPSGQGGEQEGEEQMQFDAVDEDEDDDAEGIEEDIEGE